jgi:hypothetical protein
MLTTVDENYTEPTTFRGRLLSLSKSKEAEGLVLRQDRRKSSTFTLYDENDQLDNLMSENEFGQKRSKIYETYADFYLRTKRTGSLAVPSSLYTSQQQKGY